MDRRLLFIVVPVCLGALLWLALSEPRRTGRPHTPAAGVPSVQAPREPTRDLPRPPLPVATPPSPFSMPRAFVPTTTDRKRRDAARSEIKEALAAASDAGPPAGLDSAYVQRILHDDLLPAAAVCHASSRRPGLAGSLVLRLSFTGAASIGGIVESADVLREASTLDDRDVARCLHDALLSMTFAPPPRTGVASLTYPVTLPRDAGD